MIKLLDLTYYSNMEYTEPAQLIAAQRAALGFLSGIKQLLKIEIVKHSHFCGSSVVDGTRYTFFKRDNRFFSIPFKTHTYLKGQNPDVVLVQGLIFPLQIMFLRFSLPEKCKIIVQHHGEKPFKGIKRVIQRLADHDIDAYIFTSKGNSEPWLKKKIISSPCKVFEVLEASTYFKKRSKEDAKRALGITGDLNFLWVGRLNANKDPLTVLTAFERYLQINKNAKLFMIYQEDDLIDAVKMLINKSSNLQKAVGLVGEIEHSRLESWYNMADFYISASHSEGSGYALLEAMACGCVPVVTDIPSFRTITDDGKYAFLYSAGDGEGLFNILKEIERVDYQEYSTGVQNHFLNELSFDSIAKKLNQVCSAVTSANPGSLRPPG